MFLDLIIYTPMYVTAFWAIILFSIGKPTHNRAKFLLAAFMVTAFFLYFSHAVYFQNLYTIFPYFDPVYIFSSLSVYPIYFWYIKLLTVEDRFKKKNWLMFIPALIFAISSFILYRIMGENEAENFVRSFYYNQEISITKVGEIQRNLFFISRIIFMIQVVFFLIEGSKLVKKYNERIANFYSNLEGKNIHWVNLLLKSFVATSVMSIIFNVLGKSSFINSGYLLIVPSAIFSTLLFFIGFQGFMQNHTVANLILDEAEPSLAASSKQISRGKLKTQLLNLFSDEEIYTNNNLKITLVTEKLHTNRTYLSNLINEEFNCTFSDFVGKFRVHKAMRILKEDYDCKYSIDYIADQVGFGSTSSFIRMFKKIEGSTPGAYRDKLNQELLNK